MLLSEILNRPQSERPLQFGNSVFVGDSFVGIEIEMEEVNRSQLTSLNSWRTVSEGSVNGYEIVLDQPRCLDQLYLAIRELDNLDVNEEQTFTERTSNHIHIDVRDMTTTQFMNFLVLAVMFEPVLYKYVASHRSGNHFCWAFSDCQDLLRRVQRTADTIRGGNRERIRDALEHEFNANSTKYSGINLSSVGRYGSLEFRMHEGTLNTNAIIRWINILMSLKNYAMGEERTPSNILETKQDVGIDSIFTAVLCNYRGVLEYPGVSQDILKGIRNAQDFVAHIEGVPTNSQVLRAIPDSDSQLLSNLVARLEQQHG